MATAPEEQEVEPTRVQRVRAAVVAPVEGKNRAVTLLAISAGLAALAPVPFGPAAVALLVIIASESARKR